MALVRRRDQPAPLPRPRLYQQLADHITDFIEAQGLVPGDRLPPERELAVELGVSRATLAQALVALEMQGRIAVRHGNGAVILNPAERVAALVTALSGYTRDSLQSARLPVMAGILTAAATAPPAVRSRVEQFRRQAVSPQELWYAIRECAGESPLVDLDRAIEEAGGGEVPPQILVVLDDISRAVALGDLPAITVTIARPDGRRAG